MMAIKGKYRFTDDKGNVILTGENLITLLGESFFMNRWLNDQFKPIQYIVLGKGTSRPLKTDKQLGNVTVTKSVDGKVDLNNKQLVLTCNCNVSEIIGTSEIGVTNGETLISHDIFNTITSEMISETSTVNIEYTFNISTGGVRSNWQPSTQRNGVYWVYEPNRVIGVTESNTNSGYTRKNSIETLENGNYYYDNDSKNLYIINTKGNDPNIGSEIIVQTK